MSKVLIIDDSKMNIRILSDILEESHKIYIAKDGVTGLQLADEIQPDLILLDIIMPVMDGFMVLKQLKNSMKAKNIPVIIITGVSDTVSEEKGFELGAVDYITKPFIPGIVKARANTQIELFKYRKKVESLAYMDGLTGLYNRRSYDKQIDLEWKYAAERQKLLSVFILDIDNFKQYNDNYGHLNGDTVIKVVAETMKTVLADYTDFVFRYGGEEFVALLPQKDKEEGKNIAELLRNQISAVKIPHDYSSCQKIITASIGGATIIPDNTMTIEAFVAISDNMLYKAKNKGKNRVEWN